MKLSKGIAVIRRVSPFAILAALVSILVNGFFFICIGETTPPLGWLIGWFCICFLVLYHVRKRGKGGLENAK